MSAPFRDRPEASGGRPGASVEAGPDGVYRSTVVRSRAVRAAFLTGIGSKVGTTALGLLSVGIAVRSVGNIEYGVITTLVGMVGMFGFLDFGIGNATIFDISQLHARGDGIGIRKLNANSLLFLCSVALLILIVVVPAALLVPPELLFTAPGVKVDQIRVALVIFAVATALAVPATLGSRLALGIQKGFINNYINLLSAVGVLGFVIAGSIYNGDLIFFVVSFLGLPVLMNAVQTIWMLKSEGARYSPAWNALDFAMVKRLVSRGLPFMALAFAGAATYQTDTVVVMYVVGAAGAATFGILLRLFSGLSTLFSGGLQQMWASTAHALADGDMQWVRRSFRRTFSITMGFYAAASIALIAGGRLLIEIWAGPSVVPQLNLVLAFAAWNIYSFGMSQLSMLLNGANRVRVQALTACLMALANVPLTIGLAKMIGLPGPLYASLISHILFVGVPTVVMVRRLLRRSEA